MAGRGGVKVEVTENSKEENSQDFCPNYVQEFGLSYQNLIILFWVRNKCIRMQYT
jgi:hypothetical protein